MTVSYISGLAVIKYLTGRRGADVSIEAVGTPATGPERRPDYDHLVSTPGLTRGLPGSACRQRHAAGVESVTESSRTSRRVKPPPCC
jgi:hypothetical protein